MLRQAREAGEEENKTYPNSIEVGGKYRGVPWRQRISQIVQVPEPSVDLKYRGVAYRQGAVKLADSQPEPRKAPVTHPEMLPEEQPLSQSPQLKVKH
ncbi:MAG: DUF4278 domain-containing protein [Pleurocapsa sp. MO_226.B13]|nr:DUF4278 domain-containing protein [Pleurocapsa sp. MO_226.B13]